LTLPRPIGLGARINAVAMGLKPMPCGLERTYARASTPMVRADAGATDEQPPAAGCDGRSAVAVSSYSPAGNV